MKDWKITMVKYETKATKKLGAQIRMDGVFGGNFWSAILRT